MLTRRDVLRLIPAWSLVGGVKAIEGHDFTRIDSHQDRILYATDFTLRDGDSEAAARSLQATHDRDWTFFSGSDKMDYAGRPTQGLALSGDVLRKIFRDNALRWLPGLRGLT